MTNLSKIWNSAKYTGDNKNAIDLADGKNYPYINSHRIEAAIINDVAIMQIQYKDYRTKYVLMTQAQIELFRSVEYDLYNDLAYATKLLELFMPEWNCHNDTHWDSQEPEYY